MTRQSWTDPEAVRECDECGHDIFDLHDTAGCHHGGREDGGCACRVAWTRDDKRSYARREGIRGLKI